MAAAAVGDAAVTVGLKGTGKGGCQGQFYFIISKLLKKNRAVAVMSHFA